MRESKIKGRIGRPGKILENAKVKRNLFLLKMQPDYMVDMNDVFEGIRVGYHMHRTWEEDLSYGMCDIRIRLQYRFMNSYDNMLSMNEEIRIGSEDIMLALRRYDTMFFKLAIQYMARSMKEQLNSIVYDTGKS